MQQIIRNNRAMCELKDGIPSAQVAAAIKFGIEAVKGVKEVHFIDENVEVVCDEVGASVDAILEALATAGCPNGKVAVQT